MATTESSALKSQPAVSIEAMTEHDLLEVCQIEELSDLSAWGWDAYHKELESLEDTIMLVARVEYALHGFELAGFIVARLIARELHVNNVAVRREFRRQRVGTGLLETALRVAQHHGATMAHLEVRAGNEVAQRLYVRCGFRVTGRRKNYYRSPVEDALLMSLSFSS
ncbi:MAG TPA: ribosomal protein S18-alanine N-acetyltransferase [Pyrinomonadaceae bacterium]|nr:ribosomal protein S18-alanine N-acetyltransferase [Pyrinomonadaceae bacterium]